MSYDENRISDLIDGGLHQQKQLYLNNVSKVHYAPSGEWGNPKTYCGKYWTTDVSHSALTDEITCKLCLKHL